MKPPFAYYGGKTLLADRIVAALPAHEHYVEPFAGSLAVLLAKPQSAVETVNDLDRDLMTFWRVLRDRPDELMRACALTPHSRAEYLEAYEPAGDDLERARRVWVLLSQGRAGTFKRTGWRFSINPSGRVGGVPGDLAGYVDRMTHVAERLVRVSLECRPALDVIEAYGAQDDVLLYVDPPYLRSTRGGTNYRHEMPDPDQHQELAGALKACRAAVVLSGYHSPLYDELYDGWHVTTLASATGQGGTWEPRIEVLWSNREPALTLFGGAA